MNVYVNNSTKDAKVEEEGSAGLRSRGTGSRNEPECYPCGDPSRQAHRASARYGSTGHGVVYVNEIEARQSIWYQKKLGLLRDTLKAQLKERGWDSNGSKDTLAVRLAQHQIGTMRMSQ